MTGRVGVGFPAGYTENFEIGTQLLSSIAFLFFVFNLRSVNPQKRTDKATKTKPNPENDRNERNNSNAFHVSID